MSENKTCRRCGTQLDPDDNFCTACGAPTSEVSPVVGDGLPDTLAGQADKANQSAPETSAPAHEVFDGLAVSESVVRPDDGQIGIQGGVGTPAIDEPTAPSVVPAMKWGPSPELSGVAPSDGDADAPSGPIPAIVSSSTSDASADAGVSNTGGTASADVAPAAFLPPDDGASTSAGDAAGQAPVSLIPPSTSDASSMSADAESQWIANAFGIDAPAPSADAGLAPSANETALSVPTDSVLADDGNEAAAASVDVAIPYIGASKSDAGPSVLPANVSTMSADSRLTGDFPTPEVSTVPTVDPAVAKAGAKRSPKRKVMAGVGVVLLVVLAVLGFLTYKHSREEAAHNAIVVATQSMVACDKSLQSLDGVVELNHSHLLLDKADTDKDGTVKKGLDEASSRLDDARRSLESAKSDGWALDDGARHALDVLQDGLDARRDMVDSVNQLDGSLADVRSAAEGLAQLMTDSSLFLGSSDKVVNVLNSSSRYIDQIDTASMANDLESAKKYQASMSDDLKTVREKLPTANLSAYQTVIDRASTMAAALQDIVDAIRAQDATRANDAATALNTAIDSFNDARKELPPLAEGIESLVPDSAKAYAKSYNAQRERAIETLKELEGNPLTRDIVGGSMLLQGSQA